MLLHGYGVYIELRFELEMMRPIPGGYATIRYFL